MSSLELRTQDPEPQNPEPTGLFFHAVAARTRQGSLSRGAGSTGRQRPRFLAEAAATIPLCARKSSRCWSSTKDTGGGAVDRRRPQSTSRSSAGEVFAGRYRMITRIGRGGMGDVWRADDLVLETPVALKLIHSARPRGARSDPQRSAAGAADHASGGLPRVRRRRGRRRRSSSRWSSCRARTSPTLLQARRPAAVREGRRHRAAAVRRAGGGARAGRAAPRSQARQRPDRRRRPGPDHRLRHRRVARRRRSHTPSSARRATWRPSSSRRARRCRSAPTSTRSAWCCTSWSSASIAFNARSARDRSRRGRRRSSPDVNPQLERVILQALVARSAGRPASARAMAAEPAGRAHIGPELVDGAGGCWRAGAAVRRRRASARPSLVVRVVGRAAAADRAGHHRARRLREHDRRAGVRRRAEGGAGGRARAVAVPEGVSRRARARDAAADGAPARRRRSRGRSRARSRSANS